MYRKPKPKKYKVCKASWLQRRKVWPDGRITILRMWTFTSNVRYLSRNKLWNESTKLVITNCKPVGVYVCCRMSPSYFLIPYGSCAEFNKKWWILVYLFFSLFITMFFFQKKLNFEIFSNNYRKQCNKLEAFKVTNVEMDLLWSTVSM